MSTKASWKDYYATQKLTPARPRLLKTLDLFYSNKNGRALDLGCGRGADTAELLQRGWTVDAVDCDPDAIELTNEMAGKNRDRLKTSLSTFEAITADLVLEREKYDLINASFSLPFCQPTCFSSFWEHMIQSLKPGGRISCELFGAHDSWNQDATKREHMTFLTRTQIEELCEPLRIDALKEDENDGPSFSGPKHWHLFLLVAQKPLLGS